MPMNSLSLHCMWSDRKSRLSLTRACESFVFSQGWTFARVRPVWSIGPFVPVLDLYWLICEPMLDRGSFVGFCGPLANFWVDHCWTVLKRYPEPHGQVTAYNRSPVH